MKKTWVLFLFSAVLSLLPSCGKDPWRGKDYKVRFRTSKGGILIQVHHAWAPKGADRFGELVASGFYDGARFFRVVPGFVVQFGLSGDPKLNARWKHENLRDDPVYMTNRRGTLSFATAGPDTRTTQVFINLADNQGLDSRGFAPFGEVVKGMDVVDRINAEYGQAPDQDRIEKEGNAYLKKEFPRLDYIEKAEILEVQ